jgi:ABC-type transporter MlaC component
MGPANARSGAGSKGQSGRFAQLDLVIRRSFDIASMARLSIGSSWAGLSESQHQQITESLGRYVSAIYADRFDTMPDKSSMPPGNNLPRPV